MSCGCNATNFIVIVKMFAISLVQFKGLSVQQEELERKSSSNSVELCNFNRKVEF